MSVQRTSWAVLVLWITLVAIPRYSYSQSNGLERQYNFTHKSIRLVGGNSELEGRVEIRINGVWGTICYNSFDYSDADVLCRMLHNNLSALDFYMDGRYGEGTGPIFYRDLQCIGTEDNVHNCSSETGETCYHGLDANFQ
ncbi:scavenger receptor class A member 5-like [Dreissena polymorpha]|uniref:scavenger receptor class A member 5-like n=1 Tax=Dreissena polymorpha TaxID=45954 RepID=UPI0022648455|nr:scavenger receptor class A member 5-like [Dreissena polymorpha]